MELKIIYEKCKLCWLFRSEICRSSSRSKPLRASILNEGGVTELSADWPRAGHVANVIIIILARPAEDTKISKNPARNTRMSNVILCYLRSEGTILDVLI